MKNIYIGADHAGFKHKEELKKYLFSKKISFVDLGNLKLEKNDDYPDFGFRVAKEVVKNKTLGILLCGSSLGICIAANKVKGARAVSPANIKETILARQHNDANILCLSGWFMNKKQVEGLVSAFLKTKFTPAARHVRRLKKISAFEKSK